MKRTVPFLYTLLVGLLLTALPGVVSAQDTLTPAEICDSVLPANDPENRTFDQPDSVLLEGVDYRAIFCTSAGPIYIDLFEDFTPATVNNMVFLANQGYYNNTTFHRVMDNFMAQGGDPTATGTGGPGYAFDDEIVGFLNFDRPGWLAMANAGPGTNGSQFFITTAPASHLDGLHTIFGEVLEGQNNVENIQLRDPAAATAPGEALNTVVIITDPATVNTSFEPLPPATAEDIQAQIETLNAEIPEVLAIDETVTGVFTSDDVVAAAPEAIQDAYAGFLTQYNHDFRASHSVVNAECVLNQVPYVSIAYSLDAFGSTADASAALADGFLGELTAAQGLGEATASDLLPNDFYAVEELHCDDTINATRAVTFWQRGRFIVTAEAVVPTDSPASADLWLLEVVGNQVYERIFADALRRELR
ncbi:MAG: peptidylprolyl isomerase [Chloroflexi bacterium]|nr:peptidylprolyl isomerase [Chloroflexota bacterium]